MWRLAQAAFLLATGIVFYVMAIAIWLELYVPTARSVAAVAFIAFGILCMDMAKKAMRYANN
jgi:hypothetical protein